MSIINLKQKALDGTLWSAIDKFVSQGFSFIIGIILARLLLPADYGLIGMLSIFIAISSSLVNSGLGAGLVQNIHRTEIDFSTVFVFNLAVSILIYFILFFSAPLIANFYDTPQLVLLTRVISLNIIINSFAIVQRTRLTIDIDFKTMAKVNVVSVFVGGIIAMIFAFKGAGVWALVIKQLIESFIALIMLFYFSRWWPSFLFSLKSFKKLFGFGSKILVTGLYASSVIEVYNIAIGKVYSASDLGYYNRAKGFAEMTAGTVTSILSQVTFPILATLQEDKEKLVSVYRRLITMTSFFIFPAMTLLALNADPFIRYFLTEKWAPAIVLLQWLAFARVFYPIGVINLNMLNAVGRSDLYLKVDISKLPMVIIALIVTIPLGIKAIVIGHVITSFISFFINAYMPGKMFGYGSFSQIRDMLPVLISTLIMAVSVYFVMMLTGSLLLKMIIGCLTGVTVYWIVVNLFNIKEAEEIKHLFKRYVMRKKQ